MEARPLGRVPDPDGLVLRVGDDEVLPRVEQHRANIVVMPAAGVHFPSLKEKGNDDFCGTKPRKSAMQYLQECAHPPPKS